MSLKGKVPPELKIQAVEDYLAVRKGSTQIKEELGKAVARLHRLEVDNKRL